MQWQNQILIQQRQKLFIFNNKLWALIFVIEQRNPIIIQLQDKMSESGSQYKLHRFSLRRVENLFLLNGITALLGWNAVLGSLDYFAGIYSEYNVYLYFPVPVFIAYAITGVLFNWINRKLTYKSLVFIGIIGVNVTLIILLAISLIFKDNPTVGFWLSMVTCFFIGFFNNFAQLSFFGMINYFGGETVSKFTIGTAASGLSLILLRAVITASFSSNPDSVIPIMIYFVLSVAFNVFDLVLNLRLFSSHEYTEKIQGSSIKSEVTPEQSLISNKVTIQESQKSYARWMWQSFKATTPYPLYIFFDFVMTFMLFPALTFGAKTSLNSTWAPITFLIMYNIGDILGKIAGDFRGWFNARSIMYLFFCRLFFYYTIPMMTKEFTQDDHLLNNNIFPFFNQILFAFTNGLVINGSFILAFEKSPNEYKKYAGVLCGILLQFGIMVGTFLAIPFQALVDPDANSN